MGFWDTAGKLAGSALESAQKMHEKVMELTDRYSGESDDFLIRKAKTGSDLEKNVAKKILRERGY